MDREMDELDKELADHIGKAISSELSAEDAKRLSPRPDGTSSPAAWKEKMASYARLEEQKDKHFQTVLERLKTGGTRTRIFSRAGLGWAAVLVVVFSGFFWLTNREKQHGLAETIAKNTPANDIGPAGGGAVLTLADGTAVMLGKSGEGIVAVEDGVRAILRDSLLFYEALSDAAGGTGFNTLTVSKGSQFKMILSDGTKVWLNAASSIRYPTSFNSEKRLVTVDGEVYFEVAPDKRRPFIATVNGGTEVEALGTSFNINGYRDESLSKITLLSGMVSVTLKNGNTGHGTGKSVILHPGQQAQVQNGENDIHGIPEIKTLPADRNQVLAWKSGFFNFENAGLEEVMRQLARWYNLEVAYEKEVPAIVFEGELSRNIPLSGVLTALRDYQVNFRLEGRKITVHP